MTEYDDIHMEIRHYRREQYACVLELKKARPAAATPHIKDVMTRWLRRCVRDQPVVIGAASLSTHEELMPGRKLLRAVAYAYRDVHPDDRQILGTYVDSKKGQMVSVPARYIPSLTPRCW